MPRTEGLKPIGDSIRKIIDKVIEERKKRKNITELHKQEIKCNLQDLCL